MGMYALAVKPLISSVQSHIPEFSQVWYADDATGAGRCSDLRAWWDNLVIRSHGYGYFPNAAKTHLIVKEEFMERAECLFAGTNVNIITTQGNVQEGETLG